MRHLAVALVAGVVLASSVACAEQPPAVPVGQIQSPGASVTPTPTPTPEPTPTADPAVEAQVCAAATQATADATVVINDQLTVLEQAAAAGDQTAMVAAAVAINKQFTTLSATFASQSQTLLLEPAVQGALADISAALTEMASPRYTGTMVDIKKKMIDFALAISASCGVS